MYTKKVKTTKNKFLFSIINDEKINQIKIFFLSKLRNF